jgi:hypothetical protein
VGIENAPESELVAERLAPVALLVAVICAADTTAPLLSVTVPWMVPVCAAARTQQEIRTKQLNKYLNNRISQPPVTADFALQRTSYGMSGQSPRSNNQFACHPELLHLLLTTNEVRSRNTEVGHCAALSTRTV